MARAMQVSSVHQAVVAVGLRAVKMISLSFSLMNTPVSEEQESCFNYTNFWNRSLATAIAARTVAEHIRSDRESCFLMGLMLNVGQLALGHAFHDQYQIASKEARSAGRSLLEMEQEKWDIDRYAVAGELLKQWRFPAQMIEIIRDHNRKEMPEKNGVGEIRKTLEIADQMAEVLFQEDVPGEWIDRMKSDACRQLGIEPESFDELFDEFVASWKEYATVLSFDCSHAKTFEELESEARRGIAEISMGLFAENLKISEENQELRTNIFMDPLTGLKNRRAYNKEAGAELERCRRSKGMFVMMVIDIDHFKSVNDGYGHDVGDRLLIRVAETLIDHTRRYDTVFRIGGEEFVVMLADFNIEAIEAAAERFRNAIESLDFDVDGEKLNITASIGVACCAAMSRTLDEIFKEADRALYDAKSEGRNRCCFRLPARPSGKPKLLVPQTDDHAISMISNNSSATK
jgi:diguanylate cyclase (GGDEF)-like protein